MTRSFTLLLAVLVLHACDSPPAPATDAAVPVDAAAPIDAAPSDAAMVCGTVTSGRDPIPASCLPRCTAATFTAYRACRDATCIMSALSADTTPPVVLGATTGQAFVLGCGPGPGVQITCVQWQTIALAAALCPGSYAMWNDCGSGSGCDSLLDALISCAQADPGFNTMFVQTVSMCFASS
jgi:hypothetical protein